MSSWETARKTRTLLSLFKPSKPAEAQDENAVRLDLDGNQLSYAQGRWRLDGTAAAKFEADMGLLQDEVTRLRSEMTEMQEKYKQAVEEKLVAEFKNQVLMELLAVAQLDSEKASEEFRKAQLKAEALKWELSKLTLARIE